MNSLIIRETSTKKRELASPLFFTDKFYFYIKQRGKWSINGKYSSNGTIHLVCDDDSRHDQNYEFWPNFPKVRTIVNLGNKYWSPLFEDIRMNLIPLRYPEWIASIEGYSIDPQKLPISDIKISVQNKEIINNYFPENWSENYWIKYGGYTATCRRIESHQRWTTISGNKKK